MMTLCELLLGTLALFAQDETRVQEQDARVNADESKRKCTNLVEGIDGVVSVGMGGTGTNYRLLIVVRDVVAKQAAQKALGGDSYEGLKIMWTIRSSNAPAPQAPGPNPNPPPLIAPTPQPAAAQTVPSPGPSIYDCDIIRDHLKLKPITHPTGDGRSYEPCQVMKRTVEGGISPPPVLYAKHRPDCPVYLGRVGQPAVADSFVAWVFQQGASVVPPEGTPRLSDLRPGYNPPPTYTTYPYDYYGYYRPYYYRHYYSYYPHYYYSRYSYYPRYYYYKKYW
jgi:hypothetical protein